LKSHLTLHRHIALKDPYYCKADQNFAVMAKAEQKRRRKRVANLSLAIAGQIEITTQRTHLIWTPPH
jgi:hypothetical protein